MRRALVTGVGDPAGRAVADLLVDRGVEVVGTHPEQVDGRDLLASHVTPASDDPRLLPELVRLARHYAVTWVVPTALGELPAVAAGRSGFPTPRDVVTSGPGPVVLADDKLAATWHLGARDVPVPLCAVPSQFASPAQAFEGFGGPFVIRRRRSTTPRTAQLIRTPDQVDLSALTDDHLLQAFAPGAQYAAVVWRPSQGDLTLATFRRSGVADGRLPVSRDLVLVEAGSEPDVEWAVRAAVRALGIIGPAHVDIRRGRDGRPAVLGVKASFRDSVLAAPHILEAALGIATEATDRGGDARLRGA